MELDEEQGHTGEGSDGEDGDCLAGLAADVDVALGRVIGDCESLGGREGQDEKHWERRGERISGTYAGYADPGWEELARVFAAAGEVEDPGGYVGVDGVYGEEADEGCLRGIMKKPTAWLVGVNSWGGSKRENEGRTSET